MSDNVIFGHAGCGKTYTIVNICKDYVSQGARVCLLSYTKTAAREIAERVDSLNNKSVYPSTIHSMVFGLMGFSRQQVVTQTRLVEFGNEINMPISGNADLFDEDIREITDADEAMAIIMRARAKMVDPEEEYANSSRPLPFRDFQFINNSYIKWKKTKHLIDFNDMLYQYLDAKLPVPFDVLVVDEAQDLSRLQWAVIDAFRDSVQHTVITGDMDQALFVWAGAQAGGMREYANRHNAMWRSLPQSFRVPKNIHEVAERILSRVVSREKLTYRPRDIAGTLRFMPVPNAHDMLSTDDALILYRTHALRREIEYELIDNNVPYKVLNGFPSPWDGQFGRAVRAFDLLRKGEPISARDQRVLDKYCRLTSVPSNAKWEHYLTIPDRFINYMLATEGKEQRVRLSTIHGAKGMEANHVVLYTGLTQRVVDTMNMSQEGMDSEHRVFYVGVTRTKNVLDIIDGDLAYQI